MGESLEPIILEGVPYHAQEEHHCGPASLLTMLEASGATVDYESVVDRVYVPGLEGSLQAEMLAAARQFDRLAYVLPPEPGAVLAEIEAGRPVLVLLNLGLPDSAIWHYAVVVGADPPRNRLVLHSGNSAFSRERASRWLRRWDWAGRWAMVVLRPGQWPASPDRDRLLEALAAFEDSGTPHAAAAAWRTAVERWPAEPLAWLGLANMAYRLGDLGEAQRGYRRALEVDPDLLPARMNLAVALEDDDRPCEALEFLGTVPSEDHPLRAPFIDIEHRVRRSCQQLPARGE